LCYFSDYSSPFCLIHCSLRRLNRILQCVLHQDCVHLDMVPFFSPRQQNRISKHSFLWVSVHPLWFVPVLRMQLITPNPSLTTHSCWPSVVKTYITLALSFVRWNIHSTQLNSMLCALCVRRNIPPLGVGWNQTGLRTIVIVVVVSVHTDTDTREFPRQDGY